MYHILNSNTLYNLIDEEKINISIYKNLDKYDVSVFLDDISLWMDKHKSYITENYLPFSVLSVGVIPLQISAFMYGVFVGKAMEKHNLKLKLNKTKIPKDIMLKEIEENMNQEFKLDSFEDKGKNNGKTDKPRK